MLFTRKTSIVEHLKANWDGGQWGAFQSQPFCSLTSSHRSYPVTPWERAGICRLSFSLQTTGRFFQKDLSKLPLAASSCVRVLARSCSQHPATARRPVACIPLSPRVSSRCARVGCAAKHRQGRFFFFSVPLFDTCATNKKTCKSLVISFPFTRQRKELAKHSRSSNESRRQSVPHICQETIGQGKRTQ